MADIRPKDLLPTAAIPAVDDYLLLDGPTQGTRKMLAAEIADQLPHIATVAALRANGAGFSPKHLWLREYAAGRRNGAGLLLLDEADTTTADDGGMTFVTASGKRYKRPERGFVSVKDFGALGNNTGDDTAAIQAAIDYLSSRRGQAGDNWYGRSGIVFVPQGKYLINVPLILKQGVILRGEGTFSTTIVPISFTGSAVIIFEDADTNLFNTMVEHIHVSMMNIANLKGCYGNFLNENCGVRYCAFTEMGAGAKGLHFVVKNYEGGYCGNMAIDNNYFIYDTGSNAETTAIHLEGLEFLPVAPRLIHNITVHGVKSGKARSARGIGIRLDRCQRVHIASCAWEDLTVALRVENSLMVKMETSSGINSKLLEVYGASFGTLDSVDQVVDPGDTPLPTLVVDDTVTSDNVPAVAGQGYIHRHEFDTRTLNWNGAAHTATSNGSATLVAATRRGKEYTVWVQVTTPLNGTATFRLGNGTTDNRYLAATGASTTGYHHVPVKIMGDGLPIVLTWASTSAGQLVSRLRVS